MCAIKPMSKDQLDEYAREACDVGALGEDEVLIMADEIQRLWAIEQSGVEAVYNAVVRLRASTTREKFPMRMMLQLLGECEWTDNENCKSFLRGWAQDYSPRVPRGIVDEVAWAEEY